MDDLFPNAPRFPPPLPDDELRLLATLPDWDTVQEIYPKDEATARRLEKRGLIRVCCWKDDPISIRRTMFAGRLHSSRLTLKLPADLIKEAPDRG